MVKVSTYSTSNGAPQSATLILLNGTDTMNKGKAQFALHAGDTIDIDKQIQIGNFTDREVQSAKSGRNSFMVWRSNFHISNFNIERSEEDAQKKAIFLYANFLQDKSLTMENLFVNVTWSLVMSSDPMNGYFRNITVDIYKTREIFELYAPCNFPEASIKNEIILDDIKIVESNFKLFTELVNFIAYSGPGNLTIRNVDSRDFYGFSTLRYASIIMLGSGNCLPQDDLVQKFTLENMELSLKNRGNKYTMMNSIVSIFGSTILRKAVTNATNIRYIDYHDSDSQLFFFTGSPTSELYMKNILFQNISTTTGYPISNLITGSKVSIQNMAFKNCYKLYREAIRISSFNDIQITNLTYSDFT